METRYHCSVCDVSYYFLSYLKFIDRFELAGLRFVRAVLREDQTRAQDGQAGPGLGGRVLVGRQAVEPGREPPPQHPALHPEPGARVPVPQRQLRHAVMLEDEASRVAHEALQAKDQWRLSHLQATNCSMLLPRKALSGTEVSRSILSQHKTQTTSAAAATPHATSSTAAAKNGQHECRECAQCGAGVQRQQPAVDAAASAVARTAPSRGWRQNWGFWEAGFRATTRRNARRAAGAARRADADAKHEPICLASCG